jgi:hypothetical protein
MAALAHLVRICCGFYAAECKFNLEVKINAESSLSFYGLFYLSAAVFSFIFTLAGSIKFNAEIILFARLNLNHSRPTPVRPHLMVLIVIKSGGGTPLIIFVFELGARMTGSCAGRNFIFWLRSRVIGAGTALAVCLSLRAHSPSTQLSEVVIKKRFNVASGKTLRLMSFAFFVFDPHAEIF